MMRPLWAVLGALFLLVVWLGLIAYQTSGDVPAALTALGDSAARGRLPGLAAKCYLKASVLERQQLAVLDRDSAAAQVLVERIISHRMAAAQTLLRAGQVAAAERVALEGARADYDDVPARALLLEVRLQGPDADAARRELMVMVLQQEHPQLLHLLGKAFLDRRQYADAESFFRRALSHDASHVPSLLGMAEVAASRYDRHEINAWLDKAMAAAELPAEQRQIRELRVASPEPWQRLAQDVTALGRDHWGTLLFAAAYLLFLFSPGLYALCRRGRAGQGAGGATGSTSGIAASL